MDRFPRPRHVPLYRGSAAGTGLILPPRLPNRGSHCSPFTSSKSATWPRPASRRAFRRGSTRPCQSTLPLLGAMPPRRAPRESRPCCSCRAGKCAVPSQPRLLSARSLLLLRLRLRGHVFARSRRARLLFLRRHASLPAAGEEWSRKALRSPCSSYRARSTRIFPERADRPVTGSNAIRAQQRSSSRQK
jgi:hypothetical protein